VRTFLHTLNFSVNILPITPRTILEVGVRTIHLSDQEFVTLEHAMWVAYKRAAASLGRLRAAERPDDAHDLEELESLCAWAEFSVSQQRATLAALRVS